MNQKRSKDLFIFTTLIVLTGLLNSGCLKATKGLLRKDESKKIDIKEERMDVLEEKVATFSYSLGSLTTENYELKKNYRELEDIKNRLNKEYTQIKSSQASFVKAQAANNATRNSLKRELVKTKAALEKIKQQLAKMESEKNSLKAKFEILEATSTAAALTGGAANKTANNNTDQSRKNLIKETQEKRRSSLVEELLNKAIHLYREEKFEDAIAKWEEILALDPSKLEAKFNIEIAQDRIKEKQIKKDLEKTHIQKNR